MDEQIKHLSGAFHDFVWSFFHTKHGLCRPGFFWERKHQDGKPQCDWCGKCSNRLLIGPRKNMANNGKGRSGLKQPHGGEECVTSCGCKFRRLSQLLNLQPIFKLNQSCQNLHCNSFSGKKKRKTMITLTVYSLLVKV